MVIYYMYMYNKKNYNGLINMCFKLKFCIKAQNKI